MTSISVFCKDNFDNLYKIEWRVQFEKEKAAETAEYILEKYISDDKFRGDYSYHLFKDNCEHFATFCKTGEYKSMQVTRAVEVGEAFVKWVLGLEKERQ